MNIQLQGGFFAQKSGLKSTQEKLERQEKRDNQIAFFENQKSNLKSMECDINGANAMEEIGAKLDLLHAYDAQIAAAKQEYNSSQMLHALDEARELGEKIAEAVEKHEPKTAEERKEELAKEALGIDENDGLLSKILEDLTEELSEADDIVEEAAENIDMAEQLEDIPDDLDSSVDSNTINSNAIDSSAVDSMMAMGRGLSHGRRYRDYDG